MDARVNDFLNEINEIVPPAKMQKHVKECDWQECFDESTGYPYYWNVKTNVVTWTIPSAYQIWLDENKATRKGEPTKAVQPKPLFPSALNAISSSNESKIITTIKCTEPYDTKHITTLPVYLIPESDPDSMDGNNLSFNGSRTNSPITIIHSKSSSPLRNGDCASNDAVEVKTTLGFSLLANYGNDSEDEDDDEDLEQKSDTQKSEIQSTLFPKTKPIDLKQFEEKTEQRNIELTAEEIDVKAFKRKKRIGVQLVNHKREDTNIKQDEKSISSEKIDDFKKKYCNVFVKGDMLEPTITSETDSTKETEISSENSTDIHETHDKLKGKLNFLSEGHAAVSPVQLMTIQLDTLYNAWKLGHLNESYFMLWIKDVSSDLIKLEDDATPIGWHLEWDRNEKRYYYRNKATGDCQWNYPTEDDGDSTTNPDIGKEDNIPDVEDDAMDICTTPPPTDGNGDRFNIEVISISACATDEPSHKDEKNQHSGISKQDGTSDLSSALDSFYSDIAAIETASQSKQQQVDETDTTNVNIAQDSPGTVLTDSTKTDEPIKKKRKVKMSQGIAMKKKGVSQLVQKWINVQKDLV